MKIVVCIKQVPEVTEMRFDAESYNLIREGVEAVINPFDRRAVAEAIRLRGLYGGQVTVVTMGPEQARDALLECLASGADKAIHLIGREFAGADTLATARTLALALKREEFDVIFCGRYSVDAETGQVGPELAEMLDIPQVTGVTRLDFDEERRMLAAERETDDGFQTIECELPVLLTAAERLIRPIKVKPGDLEAAKDKPLIQVTPADLSSDLSIFGCEGSPTRVIEIKSLARQRQVEFIEGSSTGQKAAQLIQRLTEVGALHRSATTRPVGIAPDTKGELAPGAEVWVVAEQVQGKLRQVSLELLGKGMELANRLGGPLAAVIAGKGSGEFASTLAAYGADKVYFADGESLEQYSTEAYTDLLTESVTQYQPAIVLLPSTGNGRDLAPRLAARLSIGLTADCIGLYLDEEMNLIQEKPAFGGNVVALIKTRTLPQMATVKPGMLNAVVPNFSRRAVLTCLTAPGVEKRRTRLIEERHEVALDAAELEEAHTVLCVGTGIGGPERLSLVYQLAKALDARVGASRRVVDSGWLPRQVQIGLTGKVVSPRLYIGVGVRGTLNHTIGMRQSETVVAINNDPQAEIFQTSDFGVVADVSEFIPEMIRLLPNHAS